MNETEKAVAAKLLTQILEAGSNMQQLEIGKYYDFCKAVEVRKSIEMADKNPWQNMTATGIAAQTA